MSDEALPPWAPNLKEIFESSLENCRIVSVGVIYTPEVILPDFLMTPAWKEKADVITLEYGLDMPVPITDFEITEKGIAATLSFSRTPHVTFVPWNAVIGIVSNPDEHKPDPPPKKKPSFLKVVE